MTGDLTSIQWGKDSTLLFNYSVRPTKLHRNFSDRISVDCSSTKIYHNTTQLHQTLTTLKITNVRDLDGGTYTCNLTTHLNLINTSTSMKWTLTIKSAGIGLL